MTIPNTIRAWLIGVLIVSAIILAFVFSWNHSHGQVVELQRHVEAERLKGQGQIVTAQESAKALQATVDELLRKNLLLAEAVAQAKIAAPSAKPVSVGTLSTGAVKVDGYARPQTQAPVTPTAPATLGAPEQQLAFLNPNDPGYPVCVLARGDAASIEVQEVTLKTDNGNVLMVGTAAAYREESGEHAQLFLAKFQSSLSDASGLVVPALPRWGFGFSAACFAGGCSAGPAAALPPLRFTVFGKPIELDFTVGAMIGGAGLGVTSTGIVRF